ncbi:HAD-IIIC family phosphatase [Amycolatopsis balhimycina DSM 5908]|uniref:HAD-IIIC family phosphatase n=1 Tax=Amycolatopsis balhimycina DSM 5908 TaxID=1081091 RepID=A0A428WL45_AMYBA|nr:HAD-IIIC family phosphatase [Amycolatopsis balhimycina]RSM43811.1 HAD-IIIC family phosphatase [Amycolatopsis balhimycina DSM 5908]
MEDILTRIRAVRNPEAAPDQGLLAALDSLRPAVHAEAGRLLDGVASARISPKALQPVKVAVAGTFTAENVAPMLRLELLRVGIEPQLHVAGFDQLLVELADPGSALAGFAPDVTLCLLHDQALLPQTWDPADLAGLAERIDGRLTLLEQAVAGFVRRSASTVVLHTVALSRPEQRKVIGFAGRAELGRLWREVNSRLLRLAADHPAVQVLDFEALLADVPGPVRDDRLYRFAGMAWTPAVELAYAREAAAFCRAASGLAKKLLVLDLDNTLWGGVLGDDGPDGIQLGGGYPGNCYTGLQRALAGLRSQGVLLAVCSKNEQALVDSVLTGHPEQVLRSDDFVARIANWGRKDHNIRQVVQALNLGLDSVVFADDSPFECDLVRRELPEATVVQLDGDPAGHLAAVLEPQFFGAVATTSTDRERTSMYRARADREQFAASIDSAEDYLTELGLRVRIAPADEYSLPRVIQLGLRTNQFNLAPRAHTEGRTREMAASPDHLVLGFEVEDRFGSEGIVGAVWVTRGAGHWLIENFVMSCRVFARGVEHAVLARLAAMARAAGVTALHAVYRPGERNKAAAGLVTDFGVLPGGRYALDLTTNAVPVPEWITLEEFTHV